jgi:hypothetical protein
LSAFGSASPQFVDLEKGGDIYSIREEDDDFRAYNDRKNLIELVSFLRSEAPCNWPFESNRKISADPTLVYQNCNRFSSVPLDESADSADVHAFGNDADFVGDGINKVPPSSSLPLKTKPGSPKPPPRKPEPEAPPKPESPKRPPRKPKPEAPPNPESPKPPPRKPKPEAPPKPESPIPPPRKPKSDTPPEPESPTPLPRKSKPETLEKLEAILESPNDLPEPIKPNFQPKPVPLIPDPAPKPSYLPRPTPIYKQSPSPKQNPPKPEPKPKPKPEPKPRPSPPPPKPQRKFPPPKPRPKPKPRTKSVDFSETIIEIEPAPEFESEIPDLWRIRLLRSLVNEVKDLRCGFLEEGGQSKALVNDLTVEYDIEEEEIWFECKYGF